MNMGNMEYSLLLEYYNAVTVKTKLSSGNNNRYITTRYITTYCLS